MAAFALRSAFFVCTCPLLALSLLNAQETDSATQVVATKDPQAVEIATWSLLRMGPSFVYAPTIGTTASGSLLTDREDGRQAWMVRLHTRGNEKLRIETAAGVPIVLLNAGSQWRGSENGLSRDVAAGAMFRRVEHVPLLSALQDLSAPDVNVTFGGTSREGTGRVSYIVKLSRVVKVSAEIDSRLEKFSEVEFLIDAEVGTVSAIRYSLPTASDWRRSYDVEIVFGDYRAVNQILVPFRIAYSREGHNVWTLQLDSIDLDVPIAEEMFLPR